jgi:hypothetical protein
MEVTCASETSVEFHQNTWCYVGVLMRLWVFLFAAQPKEFFLYGLKKLEWRSHKGVELKVEYVE